MRADVLAGNVERIQELRTFLGNTQPTFRVVIAMYTASSASC